MYHLPIMPQTPAQQKINTLLQLHPQSVDLSLTRMARILQALGNPHKKLPPVIHIAGTNGKGSATAFCRALLEAAGYSAHAYTSPHLLHWHERFRLGFKTAEGIHSAYAADDMLADILAEVTRINNGQDITVFEILTAAAFVLFSSEPADAVLLEVGLGGRFDATNIIACPACSLIMPIAYDHQAFLGETIAQIAAEKAGIIKKNVPVVLAKQRYPNAVSSVLRQACALNAPLSLYKQDYAIRAGKKDMRFHSGTAEWRLPLPQLHGRFQTENAAAALQAVLKSGFPITEQTASAAMRNVVWQGRLQKLQSGRLHHRLPKNIDLWLDGAHNPAAARAIAASLAPILRGRALCIVCAMLETKDSSRFMQNFAALSPKIYTVPITSSANAIPPARLAEQARAAGMAAQSCASLSQALQSISADLQGREALVLICGSLYLVGETLAKNNAFPQ